MKMPGLTLIRKMALLAVLVPAAVASVAFVSFQATSQLKYQYDNLYGFMLVPIVSLDGANLAQQQIETDVAPILDGTTATLSDAVKADVKAQDATIASLIDQYQTNWLSTLSPDFTAAVAAAGKSSLQNSEAAAFKDLQAAYAAWTPMRDALLAGTAPGDVAPVLTGMKTSLASLVTVNMAFADLSNTTAQGVIGGLQSQMLLMGLVLGGLEILVALLIALSIIRPVRRLTAAAERLAVGDVAVEVAETSHDEIGRMAVSFGSIVEYMQAMAQAAERLASNDLTVRPVPRSAEDALGHAFAVMVDDLRKTVGEVRTASAMLADTSSQVNAAAAQSGTASSQVAADDQPGRHPAPPNRRAQRRDVSDAVQRALRDHRPGRRRGRRDGPQGRSRRRARRDGRRDQRRLRRVALKSSSVAAAAAVAADNGAAAVRETVDRHGPHQGSRRRAPPPRSPSSAPRASRSAPSSRRSTTSPSRPTCWP